MTNSPGEQVELAVAKARTVASHARQHAHR
jgi:hypothetical protein